MYAIQYSPWKKKGASLLLIFICRYNSKGLCLDRYEEPEIKRQGICQPAEKG
jgi:hypothetical protein